jgi:osmotically-inducible protein OsmY
MTQKHVVFVCIAVLLALVAISTAERARAQDKGAGFNDAVIGELVKSAINGDPSLRNMDITIDVQDRVVHLRGFVNSLTDSAKAEALARRVEGVTAVRNTIRVTNRPSRA